MIRALVLALLLVGAQTTQQMMRRQGDEDQIETGTAFPTESPTAMPTEMPSFVDDAEASLRTASRHFAALDQQEPEDKGSLENQSQDTDDGGNDGHDSDPDDTLAVASTNGSQDSDRDDNLADPNAPFYVKFQIHLGQMQPANFVIEVRPDWAPLGAARFKELASNGFYDGTRFFRVVSGFMAQFGINGDPGKNSQWTNRNIQDDPVKQSNKRGYLTFADAGPNTRSTQAFINFKDNAFLDSQGFAPIGRVVQGMDAVDQLYSGYGEGSPQGSGPDQHQIETLGNKYLDKKFPLLSAVDKVSFVSKPGPTDAQ